MKRIAQLRVALPVGIAAFAIAITALSYLNSRRELLSELTRQSAANVDMFVTRFRTVLEASPSGSNVDWQRARVASLSRSPNTRLAVITRDDGIIVASAHPQYMGQRLSSLASVSLPSVLPASLPGSAATQVVADTGARTVTGLSPLCVPPGTSNRCGLFVYQESLTAAYRAGLGALNRQAVRQFLGVALLSGLLWLGLHFLVTRRVGRMIAAANAFGGGMRSARSQITGTDELARVSRAFDDVLDIVERDEKALRANSDSMKRLAQAIQELSRARDRAAVGQAACNAAAELVDADSASFFVREHHECVHIAEHSDHALWKDTRCPIDSCIAGRAIRDGRQAIVADTSTERITDVPVCRLGPVKSLVVTPVMLDESVAAIGAYWNVVRVITAAEAELLQMLSDAAATALRNVDIYEDLERRVMLRTAEAERAAAYKSRLLAMASHDLRQPLQTVRLLNATLQRSLNGSEVQDILRRERLALMTMADLTDTLLNVAKLESGSLQPQVSEFELQGLLEEIEPEFAELARAKDLLFHARSSRVCLRTDRTLLRQILQNLLTNAIRYTDRGSVSVTCEEAEGHVVLAVQDSGLGIPEDQLGRIFEEFYQVSRPADRSGRGGLGLGLSIVRRLSTMLSLPVSARSTPGIGTTFSISVPRGSHTFIRAVAAPVTIANKAVDSTKHLILLVEDDPSVRVATTVFLRTESYEVRQASGLGQLGEQLCNEALRAPSLIISDYHLGPEELGTDAIASARMQYGADLPAIVLTGDTSSVTGLLKTDGSTRVLNKPVDVDELSEAIRLLIAQRATVAA